MEDPGSSCGLLGKAWNSPPAKKSGKFRIPREYLSAQFQCLSQAIAARRRHLVMKSMAFFKLGKQTIAPMMCILKTHTTKKDPSLLLPTRILPLNLYNPRKKAEFSKTCWRQPKYLEASSNIAKLRNRGMRRRARCANVPGGSRLPKFTGKKKLTQS